MTEAIEAIHAKMVALEPREDAARKLVEELTPAYEAACEEAHTVKMEMEELERLRLVELVRGCDWAFEHVDDRARAVFGCDDARFENWGYCESERVEHVTDGVTVGSDPEDYDTLAEQWAYEYRLWVDLSSKAIDAARSLGIDMGPALQRGDPELRRLRERVESKRSDLEFAERRLAQRERWLEQHRDGATSGEQEAGDEV